MRFRAFFGVLVRSKKNRWPPGLLSAFDTDFADLSTERGYRLGKWIRGRRRTVRSLFHFPYIQL